MNRIGTLVAILVLAFVGIADSWYLAQNALAGTALTCNFTNLDGCNVVEQSPYSHLFGIPLGLYGVAFYCLIFILAAVALVEPGLRARKALYVLGIIGAILSLIFVAIQGFVIRAICVYCMGSAVIAFIVCYFAYWAYKRTTLGPEQVVIPWQ